MLLNFFCVEVESCDKNFFSRNCSLFCFWLLFTKVTNLSGKRFRPRWMKESRNSGEEGCRKVGIQERKDVGKEGCRTGGMHDRRDAGQEGCRTGGMHDRRDAWQKGCKTGGMLESRDSLPQSWICSLQGQFRPLQLYLYWLGLVWLPVLYLYCSLYLNRYSVRILKLSRFFLLSSKISKLLQFFILDVNSPTFSTRYLSTKTKQKLWIAWTVIITLSPSRTIMLTGDAKETAVAIAQQIGLYGPQGVPLRNSAISGEETGMCIVYTIYATYIS